MRLSLNEAELRIRDETRAFLAEHLPAPDEIPADFDERVAFLREWQRRLYDAGPRERHLAGRVRRARRDADWSRSS